MTLTQYWPAEIPSDTRTALADFLSIYKRLDHKRVFRAANGVVHFDRPTNSFDTQLLDLGGDRP